jgi:hypothetical protein
MNGCQDNSTRTIYMLISEGNYNKVLKILESELDPFPDSTAIHSLIDEMDKKQKLRQKERQQKQKTQERKQKWNSELPGM